MDEAVSSGGDKMEVQMNKDEERTNSSVVRWEKFLPRMMVRVLLVESDDSTRQIISALLRKCNYKVAAVADGLRAWEVLKERSGNIDLILTEVDLPSISGFALLTLITEDDICRNIPVIMMSSHDSIGTVHKCMLRGASDFLMKPIRINELKNLWQHVWRRQSCQPAMGYGLVPQVESAEMKVDEATAENNAVSDRSSGSKALLPREKECFNKKGSDAQSSCTNTSLDARSAYAKDESQGLSGTNKLKPQDSEGLGKNLCANIVAVEDVCEGECTIIQGGEVEEHVHLVNGNDLGSQARERTTTRTDSSREAIDLIGAFDSKGSNNGSWLNNRPIVLDSSGPNLSWSGFQLNGFESNTNRNSSLIHSNVSAFSRYKNKESQMVPVESTMNSVEHYSVHVHANYSENNGRSSYSRNTISLPIHHRGEPYDQHQPYPIPIGTRDVNYLQHFTGDCSIFLEERFACIDENTNQEQKEENVDQKTSLSPPTDPSGSDSFCNVSMSHITNWPGRVCASNGNMNESVLPTTCVLETGNADERSFPSLCSNQREAALMKFRLKRKERCYEKKVRYESRKKLADQRPRVKGQFVRRIPPDPPPNSEVDYASVRC